MQGALQLFFAHKMESGCKIFASVSLCFRDSAGSLWGLTAWHHTYFPCLAYDSGSSIPWENMTDLIHTYSRSVFFRTKKYHCGKVMAYKLGKLEIEKRQHWFALLVMQSMTHLHSIQEKWLQETLWIIVVKKKKKNQTFLQNPHEIKTETNDTNSRIVQPVHAWIWECRHVKPCCSVWHELRFFTLDQPTMEADEDYLDSNSITRKTKGNVSVRHGTFFVSLSLSPHPLSFCHILIRSLSAFQTPRSCLIGFTMTDT